MCVCLWFAMGCAFAVLRVVVIFVVVACLLVGVFVFVFCDCIVIMRLLFVVMLVLFVCDVPCWLVFVCFVGWVAFVACFQL